MIIKSTVLRGTIVIGGWLVSSMGKATLAAMGLAAALGGRVLLSSLRFRMRCKISKLEGKRNGK